MLAQRQIYGFCAFYSTRATVIYNDSKLNTALIKFSIRKITIKTINDKKKIQNETTPNDHTNRHVVHTYIGPIRILAARDR